MSLCYLDANATTFMPDIVIKSMIKWTNKGNASSHYSSAVECRELITSFKEIMMTNNDLVNFTAIFTSGSSESNAHILISTVRSYMTKTGHLPHIIISSTEHKSIIACCDDLKDDGLCQYSKVDVQVSGPNYGTVDPDSLEKLIKPNTCIISIMTANNETGIINNIPALVAVAHKHKIPFHTDCTQSFGKHGIYNGVDAMSISFHKLYGPPGLGCLIIRNTFLEGYKLKPLIAGTQNKDLRGGTENIPAIGAAYAAYKYNNLARTEKNEYILSMKILLMKLLDKYVPCYYIDEYELQKDIKDKIFWITNRDLSKVLGNTLLLAVYKDNFCNLKMRNELEKYNIIISVGSACNAASNKSSNVISALGVPEELRSGILRISFPDDVTKNDIIHFTTHFLALIDVVKKD